jgi:hypothetical protein
MDSIFCVVTRLHTGQLNCGSISSRSKRFYIIPKQSASYSMALEALSLGVKQQSMKLATHLLVRSLAMSGAILPLQHMPSQSAHIKL